MKLSNIFFLTLLTLTLTIKLRPKDSSLAKRKNIADEAVERIKRRIDAVSSTSCRVSAKYMLLAIGGITDKEQMPRLNLTGTYELDLEKIREKVMEGYVVQVEIRPNHHFVIFKRNNKQLYLLQGFQDMFMLKDWISNKKIMKPYLTIDEFFEKMRTMINPDTPREIVDKTIIELFLPPIFTESKSIKKAMLKYFSWAPVTLVNVFYVKYNFGIQSKGEKFKNLFKAVDKHYYIY